MKAKNVSKNIGKEVFIKAPLEEVYNCGGMSLLPSEKLALGVKPLTIYDNDHEHSDGDVILINRNNDQVWVHRKFIKLAHKESSND